jgi:hypothetical protein
MMNGRSSENTVKRYSRHGSKIFPYRENPD